MLREEKVAEIKCCKIFLATFATFSYATYKYFIIHNFLFPQHFVWPTKNLHIYKHKIYSKNLCKKSAIKTTILTQEQSRVKNDQSTTTTLLSSVLFTVLDDILAIFNFRNNFQNAY